MRRFDPMPRVLLVEDERNLVKLLKAPLEEDGYQVTVAYDGPTGLQEAQRLAPDAIILDIMLPGLDGLSLCRRLRSAGPPHSLIPILMLTARAEEVDRVVGLEVGADDYLTKPFSIRELLARVRALLRRVEMMRQAALPAGQTVVVADLVLDTASRQVTVAGQPVELTPKEFDLLCLLAANPGRVFSRDYLLDRLWGYEAAECDRTVDTHVYRLRQKLGASEAGRCIAAVRGIGYKFQ
jgi:DNA-binding response OmpR family regulator